jgi:hypothetical protein
MTDDQKYTLDEARRELAIRECGMQGHDYDVLVVLGSNEPQCVLCRRCGESWSIDHNSESTGLRGFPPEVRKMLGPYRRAWND